MKVIISIFAVISIFSMSGCVNKDVPCTHCIKKIEPIVEKKVEEVKFKPLITKHKQGTLPFLVDSLAKQLTQNKNFIDVKDSPIAITSFVSLDDLKSTTRLSNILSENLIHNMQIRGNKIIDYKTMDKIKVASHGDFLFSRDISKLRTSLNIDYVLTGTYTEYRKGTAINARVINLKTHVIVSSAQIFIPKSVVKNILRTKQKSVNFKPNKILLTK